MASFDIVKELPASPEASWDFVVERGAEVEPLTFTPRDVQAPGVLNDLSGRLLGVLPLRAVSRTVAWEPPTKCIFESVVPAWPVQTSITESFERSDRGTRHHIHYEVRPVGLIGQIAAPLVCRLMKRNRAQYQTRLAEALSQHR